MMAFWRVGTRRRRVCERGAGGLVGGGGSAGGWGWRVGDGRMGEGA